MQSTQRSVQEIQHPNTFYQYQDTVELQGTRLHTIMDGDLAPGIKTMMYGVTTVLLTIGVVVPGGMEAAGLPT